MCSIWFEFIIYGWMIVGVKGWGGGGILLMFSLFQNKYTVVGIFALISTVFWGLLLLGHVFLFFNARVHYVRVGGLAAAKKQGGQFAARKAAENPELVMKAAKGVHDNV